MDIKKKNMVKAVVSLVLSSIALLIFIFAPIIHKKDEIWAGIDFLTNPVLLGSRWAIGNLICSWMLVIVLGLDIFICIYGIVTGRFFKKFQYSIFSVVLLYAIILMAVYTINNIYLIDQYVNHPEIRGTFPISISLFTFLNPFKDVEKYRFFITIWCDIVGVCLVARIIVQLLSSTRRAYEKALAEEQARNDAIDASLASEIGATQEEVEPVIEVPQYNLDEKIVELRADAPNHKAWTEELVLNYVSTKCKYVVNTNRISGARYIVVDDKSIGYIGTLKDGSKRLILRTEADIAYAMTVGFDNVEYTKVPRSPKWIVIGEGISMNIVSFVVDSAILATQLLAREEKQKEKEYKKELIIADKTGKADVKDVCDIVKTLKGADIVKAKKRSNVSFKYNSKTFAFTTGKDIFYKLVVKIDERKVDAYKDKFGIELTKAKFPKAAGWYYVESNGDVSTDNVKRLLVDAYKLAKKRK